MSESTDAEILEARKKMEEKFGNLQIGGKGSQRRKKEAKHRGAKIEQDKKIQAIAKKSGARKLNEISEVNIFKDDNNVVHIKNPTVEYSPKEKATFVKGKIEEGKTFVINKPIGNDRHNSNKRIIYKNGQQAITKVRCIACNKKQNYSILLCSLDTGRTHQIRLHLSSEGYPISYEALDIIRKTCENTVSCKDCPFNCGSACFLQNGKIVLVIGQ